MKLPTFVGRQRALALLTDGLLGDPIAGRPPGVAALRGARTGVMLRIEERRRDGSSVNDG